MPTPDATTTAAFEAVGISPSTLYDFVQYLAGFGVSIGIWLLEALAPFWLILAVIGAFIAVAMGFLFVWTHRGRKR